MTDDEFSKLTKTVELKTDSEIVRGFLLGCLGLQITSEVQSKYLFEAERIFYNIVEESGVFKMNPFRNFVKLLTGVNPNRGFHMVFFSPSRGEIYRFRATINSFSSVPIENIFNELGLNDIDLRREKEFCALLQ